MGLGVDMGDLVKRLQWAADRDDDLACMIELDRKEAQSLLARIEQLERELSAERALADRLHYDLVNCFPSSAKLLASTEAHRKARGL